MTLRMTPDLTEPNKVDPRRCDYRYDGGGYCKGWKVKDESLCAGHLGRGLAANPREAASVSAAVRQAQAEDRHEQAESAVRSAREAVAAVVEELAEEIQDAWRAAIKTGDPEAVRRAEAADKLMSRVFGRPKETVETVSTTPTTMEELKTMSSEDLAAWEAELRLIEGGKAD